MTKNGCKLVIIFVFSLISCSNETNPQSVNRGVMNFTPGWWRFVDSTEVFDVRRTDVDSVVIYFMNDEAPEVTSKAKVLLWKQGKELHFDWLMSEIDMYKAINDGHFVFLTIRQKTLYIQELMVNSKLSHFDLLQLDLQGEDCENIETVSITSIKSNFLTISAVVNDVCLNNSRDSIFNYYLQAE